MGENLDQNASLLKVYGTPFQVKANFSLSFSCKRPVNNRSFTCSAAICGCPVACKAADRYAKFSTEAVTGAVLAFKH